MKSWIPNFTYHLLQLQVAASTPILHFHRFAYFSTFLSKFRSIIASSNPLRISFESLVYYRLHNRAPPLHQIAALKNPRPHKHAVTPHLHHQRRVRRRRHQLLHLHYQIVRLRICKISGLDKIRTRSEIHWIGFGFSFSNPFGFGSGSGLVKKFGFGFGYHRYPNRSVAIPILKECYKSNYYVSYKTTITIH